LVNAKKVAEYNPSIRGSGETGETVGEYVGNEELH
jgi:hypothetical protein